MKKKTNREEHNVPQISKLHIPASTLMPRRPVQPSDIAPFPQTTPYFGGTTQ